MLKRKIQSLVAKENLDDQNNFEIIYDSNAALILGGTVGTCPQLASCGTYAGGCPNLTSCQNYTPPDN